ncbi:hypothetical protein [Maledivibacter halophilus]|uniref:Uncharacterized protein n=1 Tax=Maledivibacter halophilus TaxID=36842 RepID=A0A1T5KY86_9FIRM|nr:hypothetical protein [Maledivibacter halophilus]SKC68610.1 hypothetical protein SAMN02194393_02166 [Maledivibacter halophilus]SKC71566.1 hypothetical protein SAMN02194393_02486 [Maledivibacter halophilus]SKC80273.1 hypothetical protein SAMN02194393_03477 [Maledivibacter halophilus]
MTLTKEALRKEVFYTIKSFGDSYGLAYDEALDIFYNVMNETAGGEDSINTDKFVLKSELLEYKRLASKLRAELESRIIRLEKKETESYCKIESVPRLYLEVEDCKFKIEKILKNLEKYKLYAEDSAIF